MVKELSRLGLSIVPVESCTGGGLANALTNIPGASDVLEAGFVTYSNRQKVALGVPAKIIEQYTVYSPEVARAMAEAGMRHTGSDVGVGITGSITRVDLANPGNSKPGVVYIAVKRGESCISKKVVFDDSGDRKEAKEHVIEAALKIVMEMIQ